MVILDIELPKDKCSIDLYHNETAVITEDTTSKWLDAKTWLSGFPKEEGEYLCIVKPILPGYPHKNGYYQVLSFSKNLRKIDKYDFPKKEPGFYSYDSEYGYYKKDVEKWIKLPKL